MLYDFKDLNLFVRTHLGIDPDRVNSKFRPITEKLTRAQLDKSVKIDLTGIYYTDRKGNMHKGFLYIESGYSQRIIEKAKTSVPKFHIANCETIQSQKQRQNFNGHYVFSNDVVKMEDRYDRVVKEPEICGYCVKLQENVYKGMRTSDYKEKVIFSDEEADNFFDADLPRDVPTDFWGYTHDWNETSKNYRIKKKFTCENCGINLNRNLASGYYLETHHLDGNPKNSDENNLKCLCVLCHANADKYHQQNYSRGAGRQKLVDFIKLFEDELMKLGNLYLKKYKKS